MGNRNRRHKKNNFIGKRNQQEEPVSQSKIPVKHRGDTETEKPADMK